MKNSKGFLSFLWIWGGQLGSMLGSSLTSFSLGVYILQKTGSVTQFSITLICMTLPGLLVSPLAGIIVDRWSRRGMMIISDLLAGISTLGIGVILTFSHLELWHIYLSVGISSIATSIQFPAYQSIVSQIVENEHLGRANGLIQVCEALTLIVAPPLAGVLLPLIHLKGIILTNVFTFFFSIFSILTVRLPAQQQDFKTEKKQSMFIDLKDAINYLRYKELLWYLLYVAFTNFLLGFENVYLQPLILSLGNVQKLSYVLSVVGISMVAGGAIMSAWGGPKRKARAVLRFGFISALAFSMIGISTQIPIISTFLFICFFFIPFGNSCSQVIWQSRVEPEIQGRVFALRRMVGMSLMPIAYFLSGTLSEKILTPFMSKDSFGAQVFGKWLGMGQGAGIRLFFILIGICWMILSITLYFKKEIRKLDEEIPLDNNNNKSFISVQ